MDTLSVLSYNVSSNGCLAGLKFLLDLYRPSLVFLQEITLTTPQLNTRIGALYQGQSNIDPSDTKRPGTACLWRADMQVTVNNLISCRIQSLQFNNFRFINVYAQSGSQGQRSRKNLFGVDLLNIIAT